MEDETLIDTTWVRLVTTEDGENNAVTGTSPGEVGHQRALPSLLHLKGDVRGLAGGEDVRDGAGGQLGNVDGDCVSVEERGTAP